MRNGLCRKTLGAIFSVVLLFFCTSGYAENIDPDDDGSQYAYGENIGWLNFEPMFGPGVTVSDAELTGSVWAENIGWINLSPVNYGGVFNDGSGNLSGYAWGENVGWINFAPTGGGVTIDADGNFDGWAWGENIGWIHFQNLTIPYKVQTGWLSSQTPGDCNGDGNINVQDVICIINVILDTGTASGSPDCNDDGNVNVLDVICVINKILGG